MRLTMIDHAPRLSRRRSWRRWIPSLQLQALVYVAALVLL